MSFSFASIPQKKGLSPFLLQVKKYFYPLLFVNFQPLIRIFNNYRPSLFQKRGVGGELERKLERGTMV